MFGYDRTQVDAAAKPKRQQRIEDQRSRCYQLTRHNLWELTIFLFVSICAFNVRDVNLFMIVSEPMRQLLGYPPPAYLVSLALILYLCSAVTLKVAALVNGSKPETTWNHLGYRSAFYFFYSFTGSIAEHFVPVFVIGLLLYGLDQCHLRMHNNRTLKDCGAVIGTL